jgi:phosphate transport system protein
MRMDFHRQLELLRADTSAMCGLAGDAVGRATRALLDVDVEVARRVVLDVEELRKMHNGVERRTLGLLARQAPVAGDLRTVVAGIHVAADADRMGGLAAHVAKVCIRYHPESPIPAELRGRFEEMGRLAVESAERCRVALLDVDCAQAQLIRRDDEAMETLHRGLFEAVMSPRWSHGAGMASDVVLLGRFYGRFADHAEGIARRLIFQANGLSADRDYAV